MKQLGQCTLDEKQMRQRRLGNTKLIEHGIQTEQSDIRVHVSVEGQCVYVFHTSDAVSVLKKAPRTYTRMPIFSHFRAARIQTADGYLVPPGDIHSCRRVFVPDDIFAAADFDQKDMTSVSPTSC
jgi:hypothetical protein